MDYALAEQLKDAGFPQSEKREAHYLNPRGLHAFYPDVIGEDAYFPTLEELIEACHPKFIALKAGLGCWFAEGERQSEFQEAKGTSPTEAVARLWLSLNSSAGS